MFVAQGYIILSKYVRFILFFHIMAIFLFLGKLKRVKLRFWFLLFFIFFKLHTKKLYCTRAVTHNFTKMKLQHRCFPEKFSKFLRIPCLQTEHLWTTASEESILQFVLNEISNHVLLQENSSSYEI